MLPTDEDITSLGIDRLVSQFQEKDEIEGFLRTFLEEFENIEEALLELLNNRGIDTAIGAQLDLIGKLVNESRRGRNDDAYRQAIYLRIFINNSEGTPENVLSCLKIVTNASWVNLWEHYPASIHAITNGSEISSETISILNKVILAGVSSVRVIYDPTGEALTPSDIVGSTAQLVTGNAELIVTQDGDYIVVVSGYNYGNIEHAILSEIDEDGNIYTGYESVGICPDIYA